MLSTESRSEEVTERDLLPKESSAESSSPSVSPDLRTRRTISLLLKKESERNYLPLESLTLTGLDKILPSSFSRFSWSILLIMLSETTQESTGSAKRSTEKWEVSLLLVRNIEVSEPRVTEITREDLLSRLTTREETKLNSEDSDNLFIKNFIFYGIYGVSYEWRCQKRVLARVKTRLECYRRRESEWCCGCNQEVPRVDIVTIEWLGWWVYEWVWG